MTQDRQKRLWAIGSAAVLAAAVMGLITGTRPPNMQELETPAYVSDQGSAPKAPAYGELRTENWGPNRGMYEGAFAWLRSLGPDMDDPVQSSEEAHQKALELRRKRRAYAGAPPIIPHPVQQRDAGACLSCHHKGARIAGLRAPPMSHEPYAVCVQCHAAQREGSEFLGEFAASNVFEGATEPGRGRVAWEGAPPTIPHSTFMRENCSSCHGLQGAFGLRTPHPDQLSCTQCHAPAADFDQNKPPALPNAQPIAP